MSSLDLHNLYEQCAAFQEDEFTVLESIYTSLLSVHPNPSQKPGRILNLTIPISLPSPTTTHLSVVSLQPSSSALIPVIENVLHLPPFNLRVFLPPAYPLSDPPKPIYLRANLPSQDGISGNWLSPSMLKQVQDKLRDMWDEEKANAGEGIGVLWKWWDWVGGGEFLPDLGLVEGGELHLSIPPMMPPSTFHTLLKTYNAGQLHSSFENTAFSCSICMENRKGKSCIRMPSCGCVFCTPCLNSCWTLAIEEGTLENVSCPSVSCVKSRVTRDPQKPPPPADGSSESELEGGDVTPELVECVVGNESRERWEQLKERRRAEIDPLYTVCPQPNCQAAVPPPPAPTAADLVASSTNSKRAIRLADISKPPSSPGPSFSDVTATSPTAVRTTQDRWARYRICPKCEFSFCLYCSATWHGPHTPCAFPQTSLIVQEYLSYPAGSAGRKRMELRRGKGNLERMVSKWREDEENKKWLESRTRACAGCGVRVEKSYGCNHMTCGRCSAHFCFRCGQSVSPQDPYAHYRRAGTSCYERLFDQEEIERFERETVMGIAGLQVADEGEWRDPRGFWEW